MRNTAEIALGTNIGFVTTALHTKYRRNRFLDLGNFQFVVWVPILSKGSHTQCTKTSSWGFPTRLKVWLDLSRTGPFWVIFCKKFGRIFLHLRERERLRHQNIKVSHRHSIWSWRAIDCIRCVNRGQLIVPDWHYRIGYEHRVCKHWVVSWHVTDSGLQGIWLCSILDHSQGSRSLRRVTDCNRGRKSRVIAGLWPVLGQIPTLYVDSVSIRIDKSWL